MSGYERATMDVSNLERDARVSAMKDSLSGRHSNFNRARRRECQVHGAARDFRLDRTLKRASRNVAARCPGGGWFERSWPNIACVIAATRERGRRSVN